MSRRDVDVVVVGAGPAGAVAATVLARAGARVRLLDRARFPRPKLCGDTLNPGALAILRRLDLAAPIEPCSLRIDGMLVTGEGGVRIEGRYPDGLHGIALRRSVLDAALVSAAVSAGVTFEDGVTVKAPLLESPTPSIVRGVSLSGPGSPPIHAPVTIAADGRHSTLAFALGLARHPPAPRRWAIGMQVSGMTGAAAFGEMHIRRGHYIGVAPLPGGLTNICVVRPSQALAGTLRDPAAVLLAALAADPELRQRMQGVQAASAAGVLGPLAVDAVADAAVPEGLLLAGDACGFVDPMTGDGLRFALRGGELAGLAALRVLEHGWDGVQRDLALHRRQEFAAKWRFNRALRALVGSPAGVWAATRSARFAPAVVRALITRASDCDLARIRPAVR